MDFTQLSTEARPRRLVQGEDLREAVRATLAAAGSDRAARPRRKVTTRAGCPTMARRVCSPASIVRRAPRARGRRAKLSSTALASYARSAVEQLHSRCTSRRRHRRRVVKAAHRARPFVLDLFGSAGAAGGLAASSGLRRRRRVRRLHDLGLLGGRRDGLLALGRGRVARLLLEGLGVERDVGEVALGLARLAVRRFSSAVATRRFGVQPGKLRTCFEKADQQGCVRCVDGFRSWTTTVSLVADASVSARILLNASLAASSRRWAAADFSAKPLRSMRSSKHPNP